MFLLAQVLAGYSVSQLAVLIIVIAAIVAIVVVVLRQMGVAVPPFIVQIGWIIAAAFIGVLAIYLLFSLVGRV